MLYYSTIILFFLCFAYLSAKSLKFGIYLISALLPAYLVRFAILGIPATLLEGMILILFVFWLVKEKISLNPAVWLKNIRLKQNRNNAVPKFLRWPVILLLIASTISVFTSPNLQAAAGIWKAYFIEPIMFLLVFAYNIKTGEEIKKVIRCLGITIIAIGILAVIQKLTGALIPNPFWQAEETRRITAFFGYPNASALFVLPIVILTISNLINPIRFEPRKLKKISVFCCKSLNILIITLGLLTIIWTKSTGALLGLIGGIIALLLLYKKTRLPALLVILAILLIFSFNTTIQNKIGDSLFLAFQTKLPLQPTDFAMRSQQWRETISMLKDTPIYGAGLFGYQTLIAPYHVNKHIEIYLYPHNFFLNFWTETGLLGLISIIWMIFIFFYLAYIIIKNSKLEIYLKLLHADRYGKIQNSKLLTLANISAMIALLIHGLVDVPYFKNDLAVLFWIIVGMVIVLYNERRSAGAVERDALEKR